MSLAKSPQSSSVKEFLDRGNELRRRIAGRLRVGLKASSERIGLRRDLSVRHVPPEAKIPISVRPLELADIAVVLPFEDDQGQVANRIEIANRRAMAVRHVAGGFVAVDDRNGTPCYVQWLFAASDNDYIAKLVGFPQLAADEALLENAYTPPAYRGMRIMSAAMALIAERAADIGARYVLTFVGEDNIASLKGCQRAGFAPHLIHRQDQYAFGIVRRQHFTVMDADDPRRAKVY